MIATQSKLERPIRVVLFGSGPTLEYGVKEFISRLEDHPDIDFLGGFCQARGQSLLDILQDLWHRRGFLAVPIFLANIGNGLIRLILQSQNEIRLNRKIKALKNRIHSVPDIHAEEVISQLRSLDPDLGLIYSSPILKPKLFEVPRFGTLGIHHGNAPEYRGKKTTFWEIFSGEDTAGVVIQKINAGLDTGDIVKRGQVQIGKRALGTVWKELEQLGLELYIQAILEVKLCTANYRPQIGNKGKLYRDPSFGQILTLWLRQFKRRVL